MAETLKPCPFCGGPAVNVGCEYITCGAGWNPDCAGHKVRADTDEWNTRALASSPTAADLDKPNALLPTEERVAQIIEDKLFPIFGAGPYEETANAVMRALAKPDEGVLLAALRKHFDDGRVTVSRVNEDGSMTIEVPSLSDNAGAP